MDEYLNEACLLHRCVTQNYFAENDMIILMIVRLHNMHIIASVYTIQCNNPIHCYSKSRHVFFFCFFQIEDKQQILL